MMVKQKNSGQRLRGSGDPNKAKKKISRRKLRAEGRQVWKKLRTESVGLARTPRAQTEINR